MALSQIGGDGLFTKEIQRRCSTAAADVAVHSLKDLPTIPSTGLVLAACRRAGPTGDAFVSRRHRALRRPAAGARRGDEQPAPAGAAAAPPAGPEAGRDMRGNVETRLRKLDEQGLDAIILAEAGLVRLGLADRITEMLDRAWMLPAVGQGALGLECRADDARDAGACWRR